MERDILTLLIILRDHIKDMHWILGVCLKVDELRSRGIISKDEWTKLLMYIRQNRPQKGKYYTSNIDQSCHTYYWRPGEALIRQLWVNYLIRKEERNKNEECKSIIDNP